MRRRGLALLVAAGALALLGTLATAFVTLARLERRASVQRISASRALLLARSGIEDTLARLSSGQDPHAAPNRYGGEDWDGSGGALHPTYEAPHEVYRRGEANQDDCPVRFALRPSFPVLTGLDPKRIPVDGLDRGLTGELAPGSAQFSVKAAVGGFHVNGGDPARPATEGYNAVLRRMLGTLAEALDREDGSDDGKPVDETDGWALIDARPSAGWRSWRALEQALFPSAPGKGAALREYLLLHAWSDLKVIRPNATAAMVGASYGTWADLRLAHQSYPGDSVPDFERLPLAVSGRVVGRAPVEWDWARTRRPALIALLAGLRGLALDESTAQNAYPAGATSGTDTLGTLRAVEVTNAWSPTDPCHEIADAILACTTEIRTWGGFNAFCDGIPLTGSTDIAQIRRDILKANFNPNSDLNKFNPDASLALRVDKSDLLVRSTEFSLLPLGYGRIETEGRILDGAGRLLASARLTADLSGEEVFRITTQREFAAAQLGRPDLAGDETSVRSYGQARYVSAHAGAATAFGHKLFFPGGVSLQTVPEPHTAPPASWDGQVRLATLETGDDQDGPKMMFLARWDDAFDADYSGGGGSLALAAPYDTLQPQAGNSLWHATRPNTLHGDGVYLERGRQPGYACMGNMAAQRGVGSFWMKPNYDAAKQGVSFGGWAGAYKARRHMFWNATRTDGDPQSTLTAALAVAAVRYKPALNYDHTGYGMILESQLSIQDDIGIGWAEESCSTPYRVDPPHQWRLLTFLWDAVEPVGSNAVDLVVDRGLGAADLETWWYAATMVSGSLDFRMPDGYTLTTDVGSLPPAAFHLGRRGNDHQNGQPLACYGCPDATFDEFAIYDFGPNAEARASLIGLVQNRWAEGRYAKASAYAGLGATGNQAGGYHSAPVDLGRVRLKRLAWTAVVPRGLRAPLPAGGKAGIDGDPGADGEILIELADPSDPAGQTPLSDALGMPVSRIFSRPGGERVDRWIPGPFLLHAAFRPNLADEANTPVLDPLALDDITVTYERPGGPRVVQWERVD